MRGQRELQCASGRVRRAMTAAGCAAVVALAPACGSSPAKEPEAPPSESGPSSATASEPSDEPATPVADPEHAVEPPGPLQDPAGAGRHADRRPGGRSATSWSADREAGGRRRRGDRPRCRCSIENKAYTVAAVDPARVPAVHAGRQRQTQDVWDRVAGGEMAVARGSARRLHGRGRLPRPRQRRGRAGACTSAPTPRRSRADRHGRQRPPGSRTSGRWGSATGC